MKKVILFFIFLSIVNSVVFSNDTIFNEAVEYYSRGDIEAAAEGFKKAASSIDEEIASAAYYNYGTIQAGLAKQAQDSDTKRKLLEESFQSLKRASEIGSLRAEQQKHARQNMEIVREQISQLPEAQSEKQEQQGGKESQNSQQQEGEPQEGAQKNPTAGDSGSEKPGPEQILQQQRDLSSRTSRGDGSSQQLSEEQSELQRASEQAELNEAALSQAKAARALRDGDYEEAMGYQKDAEQALAEAAGENNDGEAEDILNQEAEYEAQRKRLDYRGGISDAERNW